jgi:eukaryotic-like serine/threonine-protein kinase
METSDFLEFGSFRADLRRRLLLRAGEPVSLPGKAFDVLVVLLQKPRETVSKDEIMKAVWPDTFVEEGNLTQTIFVLRKALGETEGGQPLIVTVPRQGYRFVGELSGSSSPGVQADHAAPDVPALAKKSGMTRMWLAGGAIAVLFGFCVWLIARYQPRESATDSPLVRYAIAPPENSAYEAGKVSPDGRLLALMAVDASGKGRLWTRRLDSLGAQSLADAEFWPIWSPDSRFIAFVEEGKLKKIEASGGAAQTICSAALVIGGSWNRYGTIIFSDGEKLLQVAASGGDAKPITRLDASRRETTHDFPVFLPDGQHFLFTIHSQKTENGGIYMASLASPDDRVRLLSDVSNVEYAPGSSADIGYLLFVRGGSLMAQRFAAGALRLEGEAFGVMDKIGQNPANLSASFSASQNGILLVTSPYPGDQLTWFDRTGTRLGTVGKAGLHVNPQISPDERTVASDALDAERFWSDIWLFSSAQGTSSRLTFRGGTRSVWSREGGTVAFASGNTAVYVKTPAGTENESQILEAMNPPTDDDRLLCEYSNDGRYLIYSQRDPKTGYDLWTLPLSSSSKAKPFLRTEHNEWCGTLSPDSKWIAYASDESGISEIYVQSFSGADANSGRKWQVSDSGGHWPKWRRDGKELLYLSVDRKIVGVEVTIGASFRHSTPRPLFASGIRTPDARFDVTSDGRRFLIPAQATENSSPATVTINWLSGLRP